eukprot:TRINITY_DN1022_c0_g1_i1.p2 TRINITY_DN1022_c0_g1~~TRINITY_DN1022_c0_g1_i1.p2  ORF type:complete len:560 (-),score=126.45 TRINITY_DN1022_c0_g1_i1:164-1681(-)
MQKLKPEKAEKKLAEIRRGAETRAEYGVLPYDRDWQDVFWLFLFVATAIGLFGYGFACSGEFIEEMKRHANDANNQFSALTTTQAATYGASNDSLQVPSAATLGALCAVGACVSLIASMLFVLLAHRMPGCVVWTSLLFGPAMYITMGLGLLASANQAMMIAGGLLVAIGFMSLACVFCCWRRLVPFMIKVTEVVADVIEHHPCMLAVSVIGTFLGVFWSLAASFSFASILFVNKEHVNSVDTGDNSTVKYVIIFVTTLIFAWGGGVANNICHVTYCGVFGRWYYSGANSSASDAEENTLGPSFKVAVTTSLGSICFGSLLVAVIRALESMARQMERDAREEGNGVLIIIACLITCVLDCIGDMVEYFNDWAYVQCAIRGVSFCDAARITYSMMTCANVKYVLSDLLLNSVVNMGAMVVALVTAGTSATAGYFMDGPVAAAIGGVLGFLIGIISGSAALGIINSGVKTLLACWAEDPRPLEESHPDIHQEFSERLKANLMSALSK